MVASIYSFDKRFKNQLPIAKWIWRGIKTTPKAGNKNEIPEFKKKQMNIYTLMYYSQTPMRGIP